MKGKPEASKCDVKEAKTDLTKQELMRIFEEQIELKNGEIEALEGRLSESEGKNREYAKLVAAQAEEYTERLSAIDLLEKAQPKTLPEMPHRFMDKLQPESTSSYLSRLFIFCYQNRLDLPKQWVSEADFKKLQDENKQHVKALQKTIQLLKEQGDKAETFYEGRLSVIKQLWQKWCKDENKHSVLPRSTYLDELEVLVSQEGDFHDKYVHVPKEYVLKFWKACLEFPNWTEEAQTDLKNMLEASGTSIEILVSEAEKVQSKTEVKELKATSDRARNWAENLDDLPKELRDEVVKEIDRQETQPKSEEKK